MIILEDYGVIISNAFDKGSIRDAAFLFDACIHNASSAVAELHEAEEVAANA
jgi:hypothetical protein